MFEKWKFWKKKEAPKSKRKPQKKILWIVEMPDGTQPGGVHAKSKATWNVNRLEKLGGERKMFREIDLTDGPLPDPNPPFLPLSETTKEGEPENAE